MSSLLLTAWLLAVPVPGELATRKDNEKLTRADIIKRLELAAVKPDPPTPLSELMAEAVRLYKTADHLHPESFDIPANDQASETHFKKVIEDEQKKLSVTQYKLSVMLDELLNEAETAKQDKDTQTRFRYICAHLEYRIGQIYEFAMLGWLRKELPERQPGDRRWQLTPARVDITDRDAAKNVGKSRKLLAELMRDNTKSDWARYAAEEDKAYFIGLKWTAEK